MDQSQRILILGGTSFIGRCFCETLQQRYALSFTQLNRGLTNPGLFPGISVLKCDRNKENECRACLESTEWDSIVDFTAQEDHHVRNILSFCRCNHYTLVSSSVVDLSWPGDPLFSMAQNKLWCETLVTRYVKNVLVIRPGFVCGKHDYTNRFESIGGQWYWKGTRNLVFPMVRVEFLVNLMARMVRDRRTGIVRAGYSVQSRAGN
jgi:nucleoside-diphosphate-sugar epimerase